MVKDICQADFFWFLLILSLCLFDIEKIILKFQTAVSLSNVGNTGNKCFPSWAQTHMMTHTKQEPRTRPRKPFLCRKTILEIIKSFSISDLNKYPIL